MTITREYIKNLIKANAHIRIVNEIIYNENLSGLDLSNATFTDTTFMKVSFVDTVMANTILNGTEFRECDLTGSNFNDTLAEHIKFTKCIIENTNFQDATLKYATFTAETNNKNQPCKDSFVNINFEGAELLGAKFHDIKFDKANFTNTDSKSTLFENCICEDSKFVKTNFNLVKLINCTFKNCDCRNADFQNSKMNNVCFNESDLENANFMNGTLTNLTLDKTITDNVDFTDISLNVEEDYNTDDKSDCNTDVKSTKTDLYDTDAKSIKTDNHDTDVKSIKTDIYNTVQGILKELGFETNIFEYRKIGLASKLSIELTLKEGLRKPNDCTDKIKPSNTFTDEYYGFYISPLTAEYMVKAYKTINGTNKIKDWSVADIMVNCLDITEVNFTTYNTISIDFINDPERCECDGFIIKATKNKTEKINEDKLIKACKTPYGFYLPDDFDYKNNLVLFRGRYKV